MVLKWVKRIPKLNALGNQQNQRVNLYNMYLMEVLQKMTFNITKILCLRGDRRSSDPFEKCRRRRKELSKKFADQSSMMFQLMLK